MGDQLLCGLALGSVGVLAVASGFAWLATALFAAAIPFLTVGALLALGRARSEHDGAAGPARS